MNWIHTKRARVALVCISALGLAAAAFAYFTTNGSGTGTASVGTSSAITLHGTISSALYPGGSSEVTFTVDNPSSGDQHVGTVTLSSISVDAGHSTCSTVISGGNPDFSMAPVTVNQVFPPGNGQSVTQTGTLTMNETGANQDGCQGATLTLHLSSN